jgi:hypothetical protein
MITAIESADNTMPCSEIFDIAICDIAPGDTARAGAEDLLTSKLSVRLPRVSRSAVIDDLALEFAGSVWKDRLSG